MCLNAHCRTPTILVNLPPAGWISRSLCESNQPAILDSGEHPGNNLRALNWRGWIDWSFCCVLNYYILSFKLNALPPPAPESFAPAQNKINLQLNIFWQGHWSCICRYKLCIKFSFAAAELEINGFSFQEADRQQQVLAEPWLVSSGDCCCSPQWEVTDQTWPWPLHHPPLETTSATVTGDLSTCLPGCGGRQCNQSV